MTVEKNLIEIVQVDGKELAIERQSENCWVNLTEMAKPFGKQPIHWLRLKETQEYLNVLAEELFERTANSQFTSKELIVVRKGNTSKYEQGTWCTDYRIAMRFAQWLDARFSVKVDTLLVRIANGELIVNDSSLFRLGGEQWVSCTDYCKAFGKSMHSFYGLIGNYPQSFCNWKGQWYMNHRLFVMKEIQARFEDRRTELRGQGDKRQLSIHFPDEACMTELFSKEQK
jgi:KilA-N domain.